MSAPQHPRAWWRSSNVYQIYPKSFHDSNGDGLGDIKGIIAKLDYIRSLGTDVLWLSPIYPSPQYDNGYDISNYVDINPDYGTLDDIDTLVRGLAQRDMKLVMDLVVNHSSHLHPWFIESRSSKASSKRNWYIWRPAKYDSEGNRQPPNNWAAVWGGSAWQWDEGTQEYYLHLFLPEQPDLNWDNPEVRNAVFDIMRFWIDRGVGGFRMDVINLISKPDGLPDMPLKEGEIRTFPLIVPNGPRVHEYLREMNDKVLSKFDLMTVGECPWTDDASVLARYVLPSQHELNMVFTFAHISVDHADDEALIYRPWKLSELKDVVNKWQTHMHDQGGWNSVYIENHDQARSIARWGAGLSATDEHRALSAKMLSVLQISQGGTIYVYQGEEIGMTNMPQSWGIEEYKDVATEHFYENILKKRSESSGKDKKDIDMSDIMKNIQLKARDHARTPMQWDSSHNAGFSPHFLNSTKTVEPWMRVNDDYTRWNAASQVGKPDSVWTFWKDALAFRKNHPALIYGTYGLISSSDEHIWALQRHLAPSSPEGASSAFVIMNFTAADEMFVIPKEEWKGEDDAKLQLTLANYEVESVEKSLEFSTTGEIRLSLRAWEARVYTT